jgi:hypothetical protein
MTYQEAKNHLEQLLNLPATGQLLQLNSQTTERAYEAYVAGLVAQAARDAGGISEIRGINTGASPQTLVFRGGPGNMDSRDQNYCFFFCQLNGHEFEIHLDTKYVGSSDAIHEIDVSVFDHQTAERIRTQGGIPKAASKLRMAIECKFYDQEPGAVLARTYVGLVHDCTGQEFRGFVANRGGRNLRRYLSKRGRPEPFLDLVPGDTSSEERFKRTIEQCLRKWAV